MIKSVNIVAEEERPSLLTSRTVSTDTQCLQANKGDRKSETILESMEDSSSKKSFPRARKRLYFRKCDETSQGTSDSSKTKKHYNKKYISVPSDSDSSTESLVKTEDVQSSKPRISVCNEKFLPTFILNEDFNTGKTDYKSQDKVYIVSNKHVDKTKKVYLPDYDAKPSTSHGVESIFDQSISESLLISPKSVETLSQSTQTCHTKSSDILTLTNLSSDTEFNTERIHHNCESEKEKSLYSINTIQNVITTKQSKNTNCEKMFRLQEIIKSNTIYTPSRNPPNRCEVCQDLVKYGFPEVINKEPFVSNPSDVVKGKEVGGKLLRLMSRSVKDLEEFESDLSVLVRWQNKLVTNVFGSSCFEKKIFCNSSVLATDRHVVITPLKQAPTINEVKLWCSTNMARDDAEEDPKKIKISKRIVPVSPGNDDVDEEETIISLTPSSCSSSATKASGQVEVVHSTPHVRNNYEHCVSPVYTPIVLYDKISFKFKMDVQKNPRRRSTLMSHTDQDTLPLILEEDDSKTLTKDDSTVSIINGSKTITEDNSIVDCNQMIQDENSTKEVSNMISRSIEQIILGYEYIHSILFINDIL